MYYKYTIEKLESDNLLVDTNIKNIVMLEL